MVHGRVGRVCPLPLVRLICTWQLCLDGLCGSGSIARLGGTVSTVQGTRAVLLRMYYPFLQPLTTVLNRACMLISLRRNHRVHAYLALCRNV
jgi:hypothetical protein